MASPTNLILQLLITAKDQASEALGKVSDRIKGVATAALAFVGLGVSLQDSIQAAANFEEQLGKVAVKGGYSAAQMAELTQGLEAIAAQFGITGLEAAQGMEVLAAAGLSASDALKALPQVLALAQIEGLNLDDAATKLADSLSIMGLGFEQAGRMADVLVKGANITTSSAASLAEALSGVGGQAKAAGLDLEQTVAALDLLHKNGIKGSEAGTALAAILTQLLNPASAASLQLNELGITSRDLGTVLDGLQAAGSRSGTAILAFGETAGPGLRALIGEGRKGLDDFTGQLRNLDGDAIKAAEALSKNFNSGLKALGAAWDAVTRKLATPLLEPLTAGLKVAGAVLSDTAGLLGGAFLAAAAAAGGGIAKMAAALPAWIASLRASAAAMGVAEIATLGFSRALALLAGPVGLILAAVAGFLAFRKGAEDSKQPLDALKGSVEQQTEALKKLGDAQLEVAKATLQKAIADQTAEVQRLGLAAAETGGKIGQQVIVWDDWAKGAHRVTIGQQQVTEANAKVEAGTQTLNDLVQRYNAVTGEQTQRAAAATAAAGPQTKSIGELSAAYTQALTEVETYRDMLARAAPGTENARQLALALADAENQSAAAKQAYLAALLPAGQAQQKYNQTAAEAAKVLQPYQELVNKLRGELEQQQKAHQDTTVTAEKLKQAQELLAQQTNAYWTTLKNLKQDESERPGALLQIAEAFRAQEREVTRLKLAQDGSKDSADALKAANDKLAAIGTEYTNLAQREGTAVELLGRKRTAESATVAAATDAKLAQAQASLQLAKAQGNEEAAARAALEVAQLEERQARDIAAAKQQQVQQAALALAQKEREYALTLQNNPAQQAEIYQLQQLVEQKKAEAAAAAASLPIKEREVAQAAQAAGPIGQLGALYEQKTAATETNTAASETNTAAKEKATKQHGTLAGVISGLIGFWREETASLSEATRALFEYQAGLSKVDPRYGANAMGGVSDAADEAARKIKELTGFIHAMDEQLLFSTGSVGRFMDTVQKAGASASRAYYEQKLAAEGLAAQLEQVGETGGRSFASIRAALQFTTQDADIARDSFWLLNEQDLDKLQGAIDDATQKLRDMQQETQDAKDRLAELNAELLEAQGADDKAAILRQQLDYQQQLAEIERQRAEAEAQGNRDLLAILDEQRQVLEEINKRKLANIAADAQISNRPTKTAAATAQAWGEAADNAERFGKALNTVGAADLSRLQNQFALISNSATQLRDAL